MQPGYLLFFSVVILGLSAWIVWPNRGLIDLLKRWHSFSERVQIEDALKHLYNNEYMQRVTTIESLAGALSISRKQATHLIEKMQENNLLSSQSGEYRLSADGSTYASRMIRSHRLWETYLANETGFHDSDWHSIAEQKEHNTTLDELNAMARQLNHPLFDPHGAPIPSQMGEVHPRQGKPLTGFSNGDVVLVTNIEDEPEQLYSQIIAEGIHPGMQIHVLESTSQRIHFGSYHDEHILAPVVAANISVVEIPQFEQDAQTYETLSTLQTDESAVVKKISPACRGIERRRLLDLGILPGTRLSIDLTNPFGDPQAYRIRGTVIAIRKELAKLIFIEKEARV